MLAVARHRVVHVRNVARHLHEDFALMLVKKCGPLESWASDNVGLTIVFRTIDSVATALTLNGVRWAGEKIVMWKGTEETPAAVLAIEANRAGGHGSSTAEQKAAAEAAAAEATEQRQRVHEALKRMNEEYRTTSSKKRVADAEAAAAGIGMGSGAAPWGGSGTSASRRTGMERPTLDIPVFASDAERDAFLAPIAARQAAALIVLGRYWVRVQQRDTERLDAATVEANEWLAANPDL